MMIRLSCVGAEDGCAPRAERIAAHDVADVELLSEPQPEVAVSPDARAAYLFSEEQVPVAGTHGDGLGLAALEAGVREL